MKLAIESTFLHHSFAGVLRERWKCHWKYDVEGGGVNAGWFGEGSRVREGVVEESVSSALVVGERSVDELLPVVDREVVRKDANECL